MKHLLRRTLDEQDTILKSMEKLLTVMEAQRIEIIDLRNEIRRVLDTTERVSAETSMLTMVLAPALGELALLSAHGTDAETALDRLLAVPLHAARAMESERPGTISAHRRSLLAVLGGQARAWLQ